MFTKEALHNGLPLEVHSSMDHGGAIIGLLWQAALPLSGHD